MAIVGTTDVFHEVAKLFAESCQDFVLILHRFYRSYTISPRPPAPLPPRQTARGLSLCVQHTI